MTDERVALAQLAFDELGQGAGGIGDVHRAVAQRVFRHTGPGAAPVRVLHDAIAGTAYAAVGAAARLVGAGAGSALAARAAVQGAPPLSATPRGGAALAVLQGLRGDALEREGSPLAQPMAVRAGGVAVPPDPAALRAAFPDATRRLVVFLHGLMETEGAWRLGGRETYGRRLRADLGCTPVDVRYNSGRHISENGRSLAALLDAVVAAWPVEVHEVALVGHSMGGLVARSACWHAAQDGRPWVRLVRHVVSLGSPHLGAPLEQGVHLAAAALSALPETRPFGGFLRRRSAGIRDLRQGSLVDEDWSGRDPDALRAAACREIPLLEGATHCFVSATVTRSPRHPIGRLVGDTLVLQGSASGRSRRRRIPFEEELGHHLGGATHFTVLNHPEVYDKLRGWLSAPPARA